MAHALPTPRRSLALLSCLVGVRLFRGSAFTPLVRPQLARTSNQLRTPRRSEISGLGGDFEAPSGDGEVSWATVGDGDKLVQLKQRENAILQELQRISAEKDELLRTRPLSIGIVGFGKFGQFLAKRFMSQGHRVSALSRAPWSAEADQLGVDYFGGLGASGASNPDDAESGPWKFLSQLDLDVVVLSVSILSFEPTLKALPLHLLAAQPHGPRPAGQGGCLLVDVLSVKLHPRGVLLQLTPRSCDVLCTHPMFGPESGAGAWTDLAFVYERVQGRYQNKDRVERFLSIFESEGCKMVEMSAEQHDLDSANSQFATHLVGRLLEQLRLTPTAIDTLAFKRMLALKDTVANDSFDLFYGLYKYNPNSIDTLLLLRRALVDLEWRLKEMDAGDMGTVGWKLCPDTGQKTYSFSNGFSSSNGTTGHPGGRVEAGRRLLDRGPVGNYLASLPKGPLPAKESQ